jgi:O-antigen ligase
MSIFLTSLASLAVVVWIIPVVLKMRVRIHLTPKLVIGGLIWTMATSSLLIILIPRSSLNVVVPGELPSSLPSSFTDASHVVNALFLMFLALGLAFVSGNQSSNRRGKSIWVTGMLLSFSFALSALFGTLPDFGWKIVIWPITISVAYLLPRVPLTWLVKQLQHVFMIFVIGSLVTAILIPHWSLAGTGSGFSAYLNRSIHLQGFTQQYDSMGIIALFAFLTTYWLKDSRFRRTSIGLCILALAWSGARTSILALVASLACLWVYKYWTTRKTKTISVALLSGVAAIGVLYEAISGFTGTSGFTQNLGTLDGRTLIWSLTVDQWRQSPLVGYGPTLWSVSYRASHGVSNLTWVGMAHNQFVQTLGENGLVGFILLIAFVLALSSWAWRSRLADRGFALSFVLSLLIIMITEAPLVLNQLPVALYPVFAVVLVTITSSSLDRPRIRTMRSTFLHSSVDHL